MQERQVTLPTRRSRSTSVLVLATQNPVEQEGVYTRRKRSSTGSR